MAASNIEVNKPATHGKKLQAFSSLDVDGNVIYASAVVAVDSSGVEINPASEATLEAIALSVEIAGAQQPGIEPIVTSATAVMLLAANPARRGIIIQNNGSGNVRVGPAGVNVTNGIRLLPDAILTASPPFLPTNAVWAIAEAVSCAVFATEIV